MPLNLTIGRKRFTSEAMIHSDTPCIPYAYDAWRIMNMMIGPSGISPSPSQVCDVSIHARGITTATKARISNDPPSRSSHDCNWSALISYLGTSSAGFIEKKPPGIILNPTCVTGMTGHSSGLGMCVTPSVYQTTTS